MAGESRGILFPERLPTFHRIPPPAGAEELAQWFWIPEWSLAPGVVSRQLTVAYCALNLVVEPRGVSLVGAATRVGERTLRGTGWAVGALLKPAAAAAFTSNPSALIDAERSFDAPDLHAEVVAAMGGGGERRENAVAVFARWLITRAGEVSPVGRLANAMAQVLGGERGANTPAEAAARLAVSLRTLQRMAHRYIGLPPAAVIRRRRLQDAAEQVREQPHLPLAEIAADLGYADHAHLTAAFRDVLGFTPSGYRAQTPGARA